MAIHTVEERLKDQRSALGRAKWKVIDSSRMGMPRGLNDFAHSQWKHLKMSSLFAAGAMFPTLAYASTPGSELGMAFVGGAAAIGYVVSITDSNDPK